MANKVLLSEADEVLQPALHDAKLRGLLLCDKQRLLIVVELVDGAALSLGLQGVDRVRADDFRQGNTILDVTVSSGASIEIGDVAYAYGLEIKDGPFLEQTMERLIREKCLVVRVNPSYGCALVCICRAIEIENDALPQ